MRDGGKQQSERTWKEGVGQYIYVCEGNVCVRRANKRRDNAERARHRQKTDRQLEEAGLPCSSRSSSSSKRGRSDKMRVCRAVCVCVCIECFFFGQMESRHDRV